MKISVITPSFNQAQFLPDNLRTVSSQTGVPLEHIIVDPGSTDGSIELARKADHAILLAEPDRGQSHGITKGYAMATGEVLVWLNSDDFYPSDDTLAKVAAAFARNPDADVIYGNVNFVDKHGEFLRKGFVNRNSDNLLKSFEYQVGIVQPGVFMRKKVFDTVGGPSEDYNYCMDYEYWVRIADAGFKWVFLDEVLAHHRWWDGMKTSSGRGDSLIEHFKVGLTYFGYIHHRWLDRYGEFLATQSDGVVNHANTVDEGAKRACVQRAIERYVTQDMLAQLTKSTDKEQQETLAYIRDMHPGFKQILVDTADLPGAHSSHPDPMAEKRVAWHVFDTKTTGGKTYKTYTVPDNFSRSVDDEWYYYQIQRAAEQLTALKANRKETCVIVANGPSLNKTDFSLLQHADVILSNFAVISKELTQYATYLTIVNDLVAKQGSVQFNKLDIPKILPFWLGNSLNPTENTLFVPATVDPTFCTKIGGSFSWRSTVSYLNMQLAFVLGYEKVALIGFDHSYVQKAELKEGTSIDQKEEDPNHFDPRYFQGKTWQAADTGNMEKSYLRAYEAYEKAGRSIVNATVGGKLEVFPRMELDVALGVNKKSYPVVVPPSVLQEAPVKLLTFDMTETGNGTATGEIKAAFFEDWPEANFLQIAKHGQGGLCILRRSAGAYHATPVSAEEARVAIDTFGPDVVLYRPVPNTQVLHAFALSEIDRLNKPLVTWLMDDWPARMEAETPDQWKAMQADLTMLLKRSAANLSICESMSRAFGTRYGTPFTALANGVDPADWAPPVRPERKTFVIRYAGGIAEDMNRASLLQVAEAVEGLAQSGLDIKLEISTQQWWLEKCKPLFTVFHATTLELADKTIPEYRRWIGEADLLLIAYNFDAQSLRYTQYSMANKMPECLASGVPVLAYGPKKAATIEYLAGGDFAQVVTTPDTQALRAAIGDLYAAPDRRAAIAAAGRRQAFAQHNIHRLRETFTTLMARVARSHTPQINHVKRIPGFSDNLWALRAELLTLSSEILLGRKRLSAEAMKADVSDLIARVQARLPVDDFAIVHFQRVLRLKAVSAP